MTAIVKRMSIFNRTACAWMFRHSEASTLYTNSVWSQMLRTLGDRQPSWFLRNEVRMKMYNLSFIKALFNINEKKFKVEN